VAATLAYRPDIDGLRAIAVTMVVAAHAGLPGVDGGYAGVDVFFVISGFLITSILLREQARDGRISLAGFYARRIRRILPPLALTIVVTLALGALLLTPMGEQQDLAQSALAATGFVSNIYFMQANTGYFAAPAQFMVLLHTWSLGIEEQFYLVWPLALIGAAALATRWGLSPRRLLTPVLVGGSLLSFVGCLVILERSQSAAFYFAPFRAWELGIGALLALAPLNALRPRAGALLGLVGLAAIGATTVVMGPGQNFPIAALLAVAGGVAVLAAGVLAPSGPASRLLSTRPFVAVGKVSYAWYLWHWPLLSLCRIHDLGAPSLVRDTALVLVALGLAFLTRLLVERPSRGRWADAFDPPARAFRTAAILSAACLGLAGGLWLWANAERTSTPLRAAVDEALHQPIAFPAACDGTADRQVTPLPPRCVTGATDSATAVMVWGDSHARHLLPGLAEAARRSGVALIPQHKSGCRPGLTRGRYPRGVEHRREDRCRAFNKAVLEEIDRLRAGKGLRGVIIASRWSRDDGWRDDLHALLNDLHGRGLKVVIVADPPSYPFDVPACLARRGEAACADGRRAMARDQAADTAALRRIAAATPGVRVWDPGEVLCSDGRCRMTASGRVLYSDWHHLSPAGSALLGEHLAQPLAWVAGPDGEP
jgi:peptidoglycan/LPS O-acetylase OafA/YrhL